MEYLTVAEVLVLHARLIQRTGGHGGLRDIGLLEAALAAPHATLDQVELYPGLWHKAAALMRSLIGNHSFVDGNKRVALGAAGLFLELNGYRWAAGNDDVLAFTRQVVLGKLLEVDNPHYADARDVLARFAELEKSPEYVHTYRITPLSLWNAAAAGLSAQAIVEGLEQYSKYPLPGNVRVDILDAISRYGWVKMVRRDEDLLLTSEDAALVAELQRHKLLQPYIVAVVDGRTLQVEAGRRGHVKQALIQIGYPAEDLAGYVQGEGLALQLRPVMAHGGDFVMRAYQREAAAVFYAGGAAHGGSGVVVLPCGAGKTMVGMAVIQEMQCSTLILCPNTVAVRQWIDELLDKTTLAPDQIGEYTGQRKEVRPVTIATYQTMTYRKRGTRKRGFDSLEDFPHLELFNRRNWGLIIYDEVHLLPAPVFRITAEIQARRRLGLTATLCPACSCAAGWHAWRKRMRPGYGR